MHVIKGFKHQITHVRLWQIHSFFLFSSANPTDIKKKKTMAFIHDYPLSWQRLYLY